MNKREFLEGLREALANQIPSQSIDAQVTYYRNYIEEEIKKGRSEKEIISSLGDPFLIANTIIQSQEQGKSAHSEDINTYSRPVEEGAFYRQYGFWIFLAIIMVVIFIIFIVTKLIFIFWPVILGAILIGLVYQAIYKKR